MMRQSVAEGRLATSACGPAGDGDVLADGVVVADVQRVGSPAYLRSCGAMPTQAKGKMRLLAPMVEWPSRTTWEMSSQFSPRMTLGPMVQ